MMLRKLEYFLMVESNRNMHRWCTKRMRLNKLRLLNANVERQRCSTLYLIIFLETGFWLFFNDLMAKSGNRSQTSTEKSQTYSKEDITIWRPWGWTPKIRKIEISFFRKFCTFLAGGHQGAIYIYNLESRSRHELCIKQIGQIGAYFTS